MSSSSHIIIVVGDKKGGPAFVGVSKSDRFPIPYLVFLGHDERFADCWFVGSMFHGVAKQNMNTGKATTV